MVKTFLGLEYRGLKTGVVMVGRDAKAVPKEIGESVNTINHPVSKRGGKA
jgi:hypothetical protein